MRIAILSAVLSGVVLLPAQQSSYERLVADYQRAAAADFDAAIAEFLPEFVAAAAEHDGDEAAVPFLSWIVQHGRLGEPVRKALDTLTRQHGKSLALGPVLEILPHLATYLGDAPCLQLVDAVLLASGPPELEARARLARATMVTMSTSGVDDAARAAAAQDLEQARKLSKDPALQAAMANIDTGARSPKIGDVMPEIAGFDLDGAPFRLSDYRGKVVVLDFWGDW